jgi:two-component system KDP operon response regulator KdpE
MADQPLILIVEDEKPIVRFLRASLQGSGYRVTVAETGADALRMVREQPPDLVVLDLGLPDLDGLAIIDQVRQWSQLPIVVLSARDREHDKIDALDRGADDYLTKPFGEGELLARVRASLRRRAHEALGHDGQTAAFTSGALTVDLQRRRVIIDGQEVHLTPIEYRVLLALITHAGKVLTHRLLLQEVWGPGHLDEVHQLRTHVANLRRKIEADPSRPRYLQTELGVGYRLVEEDPT